MCLRNHDVISTTVGSLPCDLTNEEINELFSDNFIFLPDPDHAQHLLNWKANAEKIAFEHMLLYTEKPQPQSVLFGSKKKPYIRIDPKFTEVVSKHHASAPIYSKLVRKIDARLIDVALEPGQILIIDNYRTVHGRRSFMPRYDGTDRWLKKINVTMHMRDSGACRPYDVGYIIA